MLSAAAFSPCRTFRYSLSRVWNTHLSTVVFVGLNPSTADEVEDDPTVRRCIGFARKWNFGKMVLVNLFAYRSTNPAGLLVTDDPIGPANDKHILKAARNADRIVIAWGTRGRFLNRDQHVLSILTATYCFGTTKDGHPKHPLYLAGNSQIHLFNQPSRAA